MTNTSQNIFDQGTLITLSDLHGFIISVSRAIQSRDIRFQALPTGFDKVLFKHFKKHYATHGSQPDFAIVYHCYFWMHHLMDYGFNSPLLWDNPLETLYPAHTNPDLIKRTFGAINEHVTNQDSLFGNVLNEEFVNLLFEHLEKRSVRLIVNHPTLFTSGLLTYALYEAVCRVKGFEAALSILSKLHVLLGPILLTIQSQPFKTIPISVQDLARASCPIIKTLPATENAHIPEMPQTHRSIIYKSLRTLKKIEREPGNIILEAPAGRVDAQRNFKIMPFGVIPAAMRPSDDQGVPILLISVDERDMFEGGLVENGFYFDADLRPGKLRISYDTTYFHDNPIPKAISNHTIDAMQKRHKQNIDLLDIEYA
jgi:hypothetical protein